MPIPERHMNPMLPTHEAMEELDLIKEVMIQEAHVFGVPSVLKKVFNVLRSPCFSSSFRFDETFRDFLVSAEFHIQCEDSVPKAVFIDQP